MCDYLIGIALGAALLSVGFLFGFDVGTSLREQAAIKHGCAEYNSTTGAWQWK